MGRTTRWLRTELPFTVVVAALVAGAAYLVVSPGSWRPGTLIMASALIAAGLFRAFAPTSAAGMLAVRGRAWDAVCYLAMGVVILAVDIRLR